MKAYTKLILCLSITLTLMNKLDGQQSAQIIFLPEGINFPPLRSNITEPRIGIFKFLDNSNMRIDIGNTINLIMLEIPGLQTRFTAGIDFFAYALSTGAEGLRLQIDAIDGFFGGNLSFSKQTERNKIQARLRILHHSAHLVDGHYNLNTNTWLDNREPIPFTKDFGELVLAHVVTKPFGNLRYYGGISYATLVRPAVLKRFEYLGGVEIYFDNIIESVFNNPTNIYLAYNLLINGMPKYIGSNQIQVGLKFGKWYSKGPCIYFAYYSGNHMFGEYYDKRLQTVGLGFTVDFF
ncbi:MAG: DUF1207 domain-containing protein [Bacteroidota bacterium]|nr:DUF1207 domain-containing protein [Bacteroidota bacterium]